MAFPEFDEMEGKPKRKIGSARGLILDFLGGRPQGERVAISETGKRCPWRPRRPRSPSEDVKKHEERAKANESLRSDASYV